MITALDSMILDRNSEALGVSLDTLMENAGSRLAEVIGDEYPGRRILIVCGTGNNGGDGFAAANRLEGNDVTVALLRPAEDIRSEPSRKQYSMLRTDIIPFSEARHDDYDVVVDCALGTGGNGPPRGVYADFIEWIRGFGGAVVSADVPTGMGTDLCVRPSLTVTFHDVKEGMDEASCGRIVVCDIGIPREAADLVGPGDMLRYPLPDPKSHKGDNGRVLVVGGGPYTGAPALAALAALRTGADLVRIAVPESCFSAIASMSPNFTMLRLKGDVLGPESLGALAEAVRESDAVLIGPGLGTSPRTAETVRALAASCERPMVIDADGLKALAGGDVSFHAPVVITPHEREMSLLLGRRVEDRSEDAAEAASRFGSVVVLKGPEDVISDGLSLRRNHTGTPAMTVGGTGDALAGIVAGLLAKGMAPFDAACLGTYICGRAGEAAFCSRSYGMIATDLIEDIPSVLRDGLKG
ncbi:MAG: NAD(P)H-hydrate dehydratase [Candidatus Methanomethylophilaceae archaeon]|jgi:NAD(P)H-hydrate epimerase|nr:NAD(P)H-hydrate dehydratase [Candidatus Methanomethylophilaceae archaeon]NLF34118.1 NAD(P)H-hydrate dehydratase [Thermoplasmatales archaeon]